MLYLTLRQFEYVSAVAHSGSLSAAASQLNVSQPSLSVAITQVERRLARKLFIRRRGAPVELTDFGRDYLAQVEEIISLARQLDDPARNQRATAGRLTLGLFEDLAPLHIGRLLNALRSKLPGAEIRYRIADFETLARDMLQSRVDLAVTFDLGLDASFLRRPLASIQPHALMRVDDPLAGLRQVSLRDLGQRALILFEEGLSVRHVLGLFRRIGAEPVVRHRVQALEVMRSLAAHGDGIGITYAGSKSSCAYDGTPLASVPIAEDFAREPVILACPLDGAKSAILNPASQAIVEAFGHG
ncbi:LysR family transcriptional regulator [Labrys portucalensis]|uniref:LysR family transcriptional regulator n=1 Tax=Labrys neptuniae TaxID=376174 RepID=A0ABV6ZR56_9HYPH